MKVEIAIILWSMSQSFPHQVFFSGVAAGPRIPSVFSCRFLFPSLSSLCVSLLSSLPPPCLLLCWGCLLSQTRGVKSSSILTPPPLSSIYCMGVKINNTPFSDLTHLIWHLIQSWVICRGDINEFFHAPAPHLLFCCVPPSFLWKSSHLHEKWAYVSLSASYSKAHRTTFTATGDSVKWFLELQSGCPFQVIRIISCMISHVCPSLDMDAMGNLHRARSSYSVPVS